MRARLANGNFDDAVAGIEREYAKGECVPIIAGPYSGWSGEMVRYHKGSMIVLLKILGSKREIPIPKHFAAQAMAA